MILINLLPHREAERKRRRERFHHLVAASILCGALAAGLVYASQAARIDAQRSRNEVLAGGIRLLDRQIRDIATISQDIQVLRTREHAVQALQADRNLPVILLTELVRHLPDGAFLTSVRQEEAFIVVAGVAQSNERVSEFLRLLSQGSSALLRPELVEIVAGTLPLGPREQRRVANFTLRLHLVRPAAPAASPASSARAARPAPPA